MSENIKLSVDEYNESVKNLKSKAEEEIFAKPNENISVDMPIWAAFVKSSNALVGTMSNYIQMALVSVSDFEASAKLLIEADQG